MRISASAPTRIDLAGGTIDIWPLYLFHSGAQTLHIAISLRAHAWIEPRPDQRIELVSEDTDRMVNLSADQLRNDETLPLLGRLVHRFGARGLHGAYDGRQIIKQRRGDAGDGNRRVVTQAQFARQAFKICRIAGDTPREW